MRVESKKGISKFIKIAAAVLLIVSLLPLSVDIKVRAVDLNAYSAVKNAGYEAGPGVIHSSYTLKGENQIEAVNTLEVDPKNPYIKLQTVSGRDRVLGLDTVRSQAKQIDRSGHRVIAGVNGDFYKTAAPYTGQPIGLQITNGEIITSPGTSKSVLGITTGGEAYIVPGVKMTGKVTISGVSGSKILNGINRGRNKETQKDSIILFTSKFSYSTKTSGEETEFIMKPNKDFLAPGQGLTAEVERVAPGDDTVIPEGKWVMSASGKQADWLLANLDAGSKVQFQITYSGGMDKAFQAISGGDLMIQDGRITEEAKKDDAERHPRTFISEKGGKLYITSFDGRQPGYSNGVTIEEGALYLAKKGMRNAMNMDGGGSTTYTLREPGNNGLSLLNRPSDGYERSVSNTLMVVSTAPLAPLARIIPVRGDSIKILAGSKTVIGLKGQDKYYNGITIDSKKVIWSTANGLGRVDGSGAFTAGSQAVKGKLTARSGSISKVINIEVVKELASLSISPKDAVINPGSRQAFTARGYDKSGREVLLSPELLKWETKGNIGKIDSKGILSAGRTVQSGKISVSYGKIRSEVSLNVGKAPVVLNGFESTTGISHSAIKAKNSGLVLTSRPNPVREGTHAVSLAYDFTDQPGSSAVYINFKGKTGAGLEIPSKPAKLGLWLYGDKGNHWLRASLTDGKGTPFTVDFTGQGKLNWEGWKHVYASIPAGAAMPVKIKQIYIVETSSANKNKGVVYFDQLRAIYTSSAEDVTGPSPSRFTPSNGSSVKAGTPVISAVIKDSGTGVDAGSLILKLDGKSQPFKYNSKTGEVIYKPAKLFPAGKHTVEIEAADKAGNPIQPRAAWSFSAVP
ncbi:phosphodiester glycosidase family protein [Peribacillus sp. SCS-37]|uniref:phosphodiester glycosidase family protein n=1 Tax=Paraperibacillus esterisolvens TaxID=3115296 RepID=UPI0039066BC8